MRKTIYIDTEEEITNIIEKISIEPATEIFMVVPKNALLLQGVVNLKLLKKEADRLGKRVVLVVSDKYAKKIIDKIGFEIKEKTPNDFMAEQGEKEQLATTKKIHFDSTENDSEEEAAKWKESLNQKRKIGSAGFYDNEGQEEEIQEASKKNKVYSYPRKSPFANKSRQTVAGISKAGDSRKLQVRGGFIADDKEKEMIRESKERKRKLHHSGYERQENLKNKEAKQKEVKPKKSRPVFPLPGSQREFFDEKKLENFYNEKSFHKGGISKKEETAFSKPKKSRPIFAYTILAVAVLTIASLAGYWFYFEVPKVNLTLFPRAENVSAEFDLLVKDSKRIEDANLENADSSDEDVIYGSLKKMTFTQTEEFSSSGEEFSSDKGKARGKVTIYNHYSSQDQPLVATTRILSEDGKLFRLTEGVVVPGMSGEEPGVVEAKVMADEPGESYNLEPSVFTIEGFKGGPKYEKFEVKSADAMQGGQDNIENQKVKVVTGEDIDKAREETVEKLKDSLSAKIKNEAGQGMTFIEGSAEKEIIDSYSDYEEGEAADKFKYTVKEEVELMIFPQEKFEEIAKTRLNREAPDGFVLGQIKDIEYLKDVTDFEEKEMELKVRAEAAYWPEINQEEMQQDLDKAKSQEIRDYLTKMEEIERAVVTYEPDLLRNFSVRVENIFIKEEKE
ncbi:MAG: hypothetical protein ACOCUF_03660 [Patescibacteria group bacterium]